jgi:hypothetical protein
MGAASTVPGPGPGPPTRAGEATVGVDLSVGRTGVGPLGSKTPTIVENAGTATTNSGQSGQPAPTG